VSRAADQAAGRAVSALLGLEGSVRTVRWCGEQVTVVARVLDGERGDESRWREPIIDVVSLEIASGSGQNDTWPRPIALEAVVVTGRDAVRTVQRASRWASYGTRVAVVPKDRASEMAMLEAQLRGVWLLAGEDPAVVVSPGEVGPAAGSARGLLHRLLDELVFAALCRPGE
jgi:hypothetical protein